MLSLREIVKTYKTGDTEVHALRGVSIDFRKSEFVSILGPSGCGKTTLLNVIGGLDRYDSGDLVINGRSTKEFRDADWDTYRNHSIGFVFQSYNLISHQTVLSNVELALTLSGVSREERRRRATEALEQVGLGDQLHKKPNQMSGGQMQRVAIARALVNNPDILLADEPTGALDTATSVQIMEIIKKISENKLVVMVTHNPELAEQYSTRIIRLKDGEVVDDTAPYANTEQAEPRVEDAEAQPESIERVQENVECEIVADEKKASTKKSKSQKGKKSMSFFTALSLSLNNLLTKKTRTLLVSIAGSIGIIGIALILALSNGVNLFIAAVQEDTLSSYPISIMSETSDLDAMLSVMVGTDGETNSNRDPGKIYVDDSISNMVSAMVTKEKNNLPAFKQYLLSRYDEIKDDLTAIQYSYSMDLQIFNGDSPYGDKGLMQVNPSGVLKDFSTENSGLSQITDSISIFSEIMPGRDGELINPTVLEQYKLVDGRWPEKAEEMVLVVDKNNTVSNITLYMLGMLNPDEMMAMMAAMMSNQPYDINTQGMEFSFSDFYELDLFLVYNSAFYETTDAYYEVNGQKYPVWGDKRDAAGFDAGTLRESESGIPNLKIVGVICPSDNATASSIKGSVAYTSALTNKVLEKINASELVAQQKTTDKYDVFTGLPFALEKASQLNPIQRVEKLEGYFSRLTDAQKVAAYLGIRTEVTDEEMAEYLVKIKEVINTPAKQKQFLIDLFGFNSGHGSLDYGTTANEAVAAILLAADMVSDEYLIEQLGVTDINDRAQVLEAYKKVVPTFASSFKLDGKPLINDPTSPNYSLYKSYASLIGAMYNTDEKMERAFDAMSETTFKTVYSMVEGINVESEAKDPTAPHFAAFLSGTLAGVPDLDKQKEYVLTHLITVNGINIDLSNLQSILSDPLARMLFSYVNGLAAEELSAKYYTICFDNDENFKNQAIAALFDAYRADMVANHADEYADLYENHMQKSVSTYGDNMVVIGANPAEESLSAINLYPVNFEAKGRLSQLIDDYNAQPGLDEKDVIKYTDIVGTLMSSVTTIIDAITYVLIAFVSISLVVSSIMIGIITYISVLERTKEIGILRAIGASKRDISRVFNAETLIIGFAAGAIGILATLLFCIPINLIIHAVSGMTNISAVLPVGAAFILIGISMALTLIAGLIPSRIASKKDPVEALRSE